MTRQPGSSSVAPALAARIVEIASRLIPTAARSDWEREWRAELWHLYRELEASGGPSAWEQAAFVRRSVGAVFDALQVRLGDADLWHESVSAVVGGWARRPGSVGLALFLLSVGIAGDALLVAFGSVMIQAPGSIWRSLAIEIRLLILGVAIVCGVSLIGTSAAAAARLLGPVPRSSNRGGAQIVETLLVAGVTGWFAHWFAEFYVRAAVPAYPSGWAAPADLGAAVTPAWVLSWLCGLAALTGLRIGRRGATGPRQA
jgi:hypothetical protein